MAGCEGCFTVGSCVEARQLLLILSLGFLLVKNRTGDLIFHLAIAMGEARDKSCRIQSTVPGIS